MTEPQTRMSMDPTNAGTQAICDHIAALHNTNYARALTLGTAVAD